MGQGGDDAVSNLRVICLELYALWIALVVEHRPFSLSIFLPALFSSLYTSGASQ